MKRTKLRYQTWESYSQDGTERRVTHHNTFVIVTSHDGTEMLTSGGYYSKTTKDRLNQFNTQGLRVFTEKGKWMVQDKTDTYPFQDGMIFKDGQLWLEPGCVKSGQFGKYKKVS